MRRRFMMASSALAYPNVPLPNQVTSRTTDIFPFTVGTNDWQGRVTPFKTANGYWGVTWIEGTQHSGGVAADQRYNIAFSDDEGATWTANNTYIGGGAVSGFPLGVQEAAADYVNSAIVIPCPNGDLVLIALERAEDLTVITQSQYRSTNNGATWTFEQDFVDAVGISDHSKVQGLDEHMIVGSTIYIIFLEIRTDLNDTRMRLFKSTDNCATYTFVSNPVEYDEADPDTHESSISDLGNGIFFCVFRTADLGQAVWKRSEDFGATWGSLTEFSSVIGYVGIHQPRVTRFANFFLLSGRDNKQIIGDTLSSLHDRTAFWTTMDLFVTARRQYLDPYYSGTGETGAGEGDSGYGRFLVRANGTFVFFGYFGTPLAGKIYVYEASHTPSPSTEHYSNIEFFPTTIVSTGFRLQLNRDNIVDPVVATVLGGLTVISRGHNTLSTGSRYWLCSGTNRAEFTVVNDRGWAIFDGTSRLTSVTSIGNTLFRNSFSVGMWVWPDDGNPTASQMIFRDCSITSSTTDGTTDRVQVVLRADGRVDASYTINGTAVVCVSANPIFPDGATTPVHVAATFTSGGLIRLYFNGVIDANTASIAALTMASYTTSLQSHIAQRQTGASTWDIGYIGKLREVMCQPVVWSAGDITNIMLN